MPLRNEVNLRDLTSAIAKKVVSEQIPFNDEKDFEFKCNKIHLILLWDVIDIILDTLHEVRPDVADSVLAYLKAEEDDLNSNKIVVMS